MDMDPLQAPRRTHFRRQNVLSNVEILEADA
jgi:hypothetical protein